MDSGTNIEVNNLSSDINENKRIFQQQLPINASFDIIGRDLIVGDKDAYLIFIDGFAKDNIMLIILETLQDMGNEEIKHDIITTLMKEKVGYIEVESFTDIEEAKSMLLAGAVVLVIDGENTGIIIDAREYPARTPAEPDLEKVTRGSRDGLVETVIFNML